MSGKKNTGRSGRLLCLLGALCVLFSGYAAVSGLSWKEAVIETDAAFEIAGVSPEEIQSIRWTHAGESLTVCRVGGGWALEGEPSFPLRQDLADEMARGIASLCATRSVAGGADAAAYGLDAPSCSVTVALESGETLRYDMGDQDASTGEYYLRFSENEAVYAIAAPLDSLFSCGRAQLRETPRIPQIENPSRIAIVGETADVDQTWFADSAGMTYTDAYHWFHVGLDGRATPSDSARVQALLDAVTGLTLNDRFAADADAETLAACGLSPARCTVTVDWTLTPETEGAEESAQGALLPAPSYQSFTLLVGGRDEAGGYYAALPDSPQVFRIPAEAAETLLSASNDSLRATDVLRMDWARVTGIDFTLPDGATHSLTRQDAAPESVWLLDGEPVSAAAVESLETDFDALQSCGTAAASGGGEALLRLRFYRQADSFDTVDMAFLSHGANDCLLEMMGERRLLVEAGAVDGLRRALQALVDG